MSPAFKAAPKADPIVLAPEGGVLVVDKPAGMTSHDVVAIVRRLAGIKRVGHCGTLDKPATGVLVLMLGRATRLASYVTDHDKRYSGTVVFGSATDSDDSTGEVIATADPETVRRMVTPEALNAAAAALTGDIMQTPPRRSAVHVDGERLYRRDLKGEELTLPLRPVTVRSLLVTGFRSAGSEFGSVEADIEVLCSKGTYIRSLARDLGEALGVVAHLHALRRTQAGPFALADAVPLESLRADDGRALLESSILPLPRALPDWPVVRVGEETLAAVAHGRKLPLEGSPLSGLTEGDRIFIADGDGRIRAAATVAPLLRYLAVFEG